MAGYRIMLTFIQFITEKAEYKAQEGETSVVHHASDQDFTEFRPLSHFGTASAARARAVSLGKTHEPKKLYTARIRTGNVVRIGDDAENHTPASILHSLHKAGHVSIGHYIKMDDKMRAASSEGERTKLLTDFLKRRKINTITYKNRVEDPGSTSYIITHPSQVRLLRKTTAPINVERGKSKLK